MVSHRRACSARNPSTPFARCSRVIPSKSARRGRPCCATLGACRLGRSARPTDIAHGRRKAWTACCCAPTDPPARRAPADLRRARAAGRRSTTSRSAPYSTSPSTMIRQSACDQQGDRRRLLRIFAVSVRGAWVAMVRPTVKTLKKQIFPDFHHARDLVTAGTAVDFLHAPRPAVLRCMATSTRSRRSCSARSPSTSRSASCCRIRCLRPTTGSTISVNSRATSSTHDVQRRGACVSTIICRNLSFSHPAPATDVFSHLELLITRSGVPVLSAATAAQDDADEIDRARTDAGQRRTDSRADDSLLSIPSRRSRRSRVQHRQKCGGAIRCMGAPTRALLAAGTERALANMPIADAI
jgi:hypothetical protein